MALDLSFLLAKKEAVPGTAVVPAPASDAMLVKNYQPTPMQSQAVRRGLDLGFAGRRPSIPTAIHAQHTFAVELAGSGTANLPAFWARLLEGCLFGPAVVNGALSVNYPLSSAGDGGALSLIGYKDNLAHKGFGSRGSVKFSFVEKQLPEMQFDFQSLILANAPAVPEALVGAVLPVYPVPAEVNLLNTAITLDGYLLGVRSLEIDMGNKTTYYSTTGSRAILFDKAEDGDRRSAGGTLTAELPDLATKNYFTAAIAGTPLGFTLTHGLAAGNILQMASPGFIPGEIKYTVENNRIFMQMPFDLVPTASGNELTLLTK